MVLCGIDFGTNNTIISILTDGIPVILNDGISDIIPSRIGYVDNKFYCGNHIPHKCEYILTKFKLDIGNNQLYKMDKDYNDIDILIIFFQHIYNIINDNINQEKIYAVITVPSNFNNYQREIISKAYECVGITITRIINEPTAAALYCGINIELNRVMIIDIGGGTIDFTILEKTDNFYEVLYSEGINNIGGNNFTEIIKNDMLNMKNISNNNLFDIAQSIKEKLAWLETYINDNINYSISRKKFYELSAKLITNFENIILNVINDYSKIKNDNKIDTIILVGGSSRMHLIQNLIKSISLNEIFISDVKIIIHNELEYIVAKGACYYNDIINKKNNELTLIDVMPFSIGVELADGTYSIIIPKNIPLPIKLNQKYTISKPGEKSVTIKIYQGENKIAKNNYLLCDYIFDKISICETPVITICVRVDLSSMINISILDRKSGCEENITIKHVMKVNNIQNITNDISDDEINNIKNIYLIKNHINVNLENLHNNKIMSNDEKTIIINKFKNIENTIDKMNNYQLIKILEDLINNYTIINQFNDNNNYSYL